MADIHGFFRKSLETHPYEVDRMVDGTWVPLGRCKEADFALQLATQEATFRVRIGLRTMIEVRDGMLVRSTQ